MDQPSFTIGENVNWCNHCGKQNGGFSKKLKIELIYDSAISLLGIFPENTKTLIWKDIHTSVFIAPLFTTVKIWKLRKCPSTDEYIKKLWDIYTMDYYSAITKEWNFAICSKMDVLGEHYANWNKWDGKILLLYKIYFKKMEFWAGSLFWWSESLLP